MKNAELMSYISKYNIDENKLARIYIAYLIKHSNDLHPTVKGAEKEQDRILAALSVFPPELVKKTQHRRR